MHFKSIVHACMNKDEHGFFPIHTMKKKKRKKKEQLSNASKQRKQK
jgi:hypothetical protein